MIIDGINSEKALILDCHGFGFHPDLPVGEKLLQDFINANNCLVTPLSEDNSDLYCEWLILTSDNQAFDCQQWQIDFNSSTHILIAKMNTAEFGPVAILLTTK